MIINNETIKKITAKEIRSNNIATTDALQTAKTENSRKMMAMTSQTQITRCLRRVRPSSRIRLNGITNPQYARPVIQI